MVQSTKTRPGRCSKTWETMLYSRLKSIKMLNHTVQPGNQDFLPVFAFTQTCTCTLAGQRLNLAFAWSNPRVARIANCNCLLQPLQVLTIGDEYGSWKQRAVLLQILEVFN
jgi:hypothetical protein